MDLIVREDYGIEITGAVKNVQDYSRIKEAVEELLKNDITNIDLTFRDTSTITSSIISYLIKITHSNGANITLQIENTKLIDLLDQLNLSSTFKIVRIV